MIRLYEHNQTAYQAAVDMLRRTGKAAVIHPTGTGKSFIGFKLSEDHPDKQLLWLSPSEYIFRTQLENLQTASGYVPENITFCTYARLVRMSEEEMAALQPDIVVLDEFHRGGASVWGAALQRLLGLYPYVPLLGLSATAIRYLDNQRNMADELFDGCIASEMTLAEAVVRGILASPRYITAVYSYRKDLEMYQNRVRSIRSRERREKAETILEALRRALEKADGLEEIFGKYMTEPHGKYIVFCSGKEHMDEMMKHLEWFCRVDAHPRVYSVYSGEAGAEEAFTAFKEDSREDHLRLLYCIDALNEGIHVEKVSGVILLRPTVSPIIYKQQIGRALCVGRACRSVKEESRAPVIFDIVNNIAGLSSISALEEEMQEIRREYRCPGETDQRVSGRFQLNDEAEDCRRLFMELEETLCASWEYMYAEAKSYYQSRGDLLPPRDYLTESGAGLGKWVMTQRINYRNGTGISRVRIEKLNRIGMSWQTMHERQWEEKYRQVKAYCAVHEGSLPTRESDAGLSWWLARQRTKQREGVLGEEAFQKLSELGMVWDFEEAWEQKYTLAGKYYEEKGNLEIPAAYVTEGGVHLGAWLRGVRTQYANGTLPEERRKRLEAIGMKWEPVQTRVWTENYERARKYYEEHGDLEVSAHYETAEGVKLGVWLTGQRTARRRGKLTREQTELLDGIGMSWQRFAGKWEAAYKRAEEYAAGHGELNPAAEYKSEDGFALGRWVASQRKKYAAGKLQPGQVKKLEALGMTWKVQEERWESGYEHLRRYCKVSGDCDVAQKYVSEDGYALGCWVTNQRTAYRKGELSGSRIQLLNDLGMIWDTDTEKWNTGYRYAKSYRVSGGRVPIPRGYVTVDGYPLGEWIRTQERQYKKGVLGNEKVEQLARIGVVLMQS